MTRFHSYFLAFSLACGLALPGMARSAEEAEEARNCDTAQLHPSGIPWQDADILYGEYLGGECLSCHVGEGAGGVPGIAAIDPDYFYEAMWDYCAGNRENAAMISVARSLDEEQLIALAAYFAQLDPEEK